MCDAALGSLAMPAELVLASHPPARALGGAAVALAGQALELRGPRRSRAVAGSRLLGGGADEGTEAGEGVLAVLRLGAEALRLDDQDPIGGHAAAGEHRQAVPGGRVER